MPNRKFKLEHVNGKLDTLQTTLLTQAVGSRWTSHDELEDDESGKVKCKKGSDIQGLSLTLDSDSEEQLSLGLQEVIIPIKIL
ncbi:hypothetical protein MATL_G00252590 [Megalops atlanticus]|uniref:Uncharacterized protein n=1 Tax=Megalops atlanticus TaxID=7932 RepID=A0A9D3P9K7_MEGAT|nr:hypothetical protein MATL_G00252590 [Megalops atlanticus]